MHTVFSKLIQWSWNPVIVVDIFIPYFHYTYHLSFTYRKVGMIHYWARFRPGTHFLIPTGSPSHWSIHLWVSLSELSWKHVRTDVEFYIPTKLLHTYQIVTYLPDCTYFFSLLYTWIPYWSNNTAVPLFSVHWYRVRMVQYLH